MQHEDETGQFLKVLWWLNISVRLSFFFNKNLFLQRKMFEKLLLFFKKSEIKKDNSLALLTLDEKCELKKLQSVPNLKDYGKKHCNFYTFVPINCTGTSEDYDEAISDEENVVDNEIPKKIIADGLCKICLESLQLRRIFSCITCNKIVCVDCFRKLRHCPYCRNPTISKRERNLEQFINSLALPCKNFSNGCNKMIKSKNRRSHESACRYNDLGCPIGYKSCKWSGISTELLSHLKEQHLITPTNGYGLTIVINDFWKKMSFRSDIEHRFLECYHQLFYLRLTYRGGVLNTSLKKLMSVKETLKQFNVHVAIKTDNINRYEKMYLIKDKRNTKFFIDCGRLLADDIFDFIKIEFKIVLTD